MEEFVDYENLLGRIEKAKEAEEKRFREAKRQRNVAALIDFATNLASLAGYSKGARYLFGTSQLNRQQPLYLQTKQNYKKAMSDYKGRLAEIGLLKKIKENKGAAGISPFGFINNGLQRTAQPLSGRMFENVLKDYRNSYNRKNYKL